MTNNTSLKLVWVRQDAVLIKADEELNFENVELTKFGSNFTGVKVEL